MKINSEHNVPEKNLTSTSVLGIRGRLWIGFGIISALFIGAIIVTLIFVINTKNFAIKVIDQELPTYDYFLQLGSDLLKSQADVRGWMITHDSKYKTDFTLTWQDIDKIQQDLNGLSKQWQPRLITQWQTLKQLTNQFRQMQLKVFSSTSSADNAENLNELDTLSNQMQTILSGSRTIDRTLDTGIYDQSYGVLERGAKNIIKDMSTLVFMEIVIVLVSMIISSIIIFFTARSILRHITIFRNYSNTIARGDLRQHLNIESDDEIGQLGKDLNTMTEGLAEITRQITSASHNMVTTIEEVKNAVNVQSSGATEQATSINEITASLGEIETSSAQTMEKAMALGEVAERTRAKGQLGLEAVEQSIQGMKAVREKVQMIAQTILDLSQQTQQVGEITAAVNALAQQSKMLALNASIEAAKAGEAGKGFSVVASEVKNLAEQSEQSTMQVQKILEDIRRATEKAVMVTEEGTKGVDQGTGLVEQTGEIIRGLSEVIHETTMASQQIEAAVRQEGVGIEQITAGMNEINQVTASFVASANQTIEAIGNLSEIAKNLKERVDTYKV